MNKTKTRIGLNKYVDSGGAVNNNETKSKTLKELTQELETSGGKVLTTYAMSIIKPQGRSLYLILDNRQA